MARSYAVERLSVLDGVVICVGWSLSKEEPVLILDGTPIQRQACVRFHRNDIENRYGVQIAGFRLVAALAQADVCNQNISIKMPVPRGGYEITRKTTVARGVAVDAVRQEFLQEVQDRTTPALLEIGSRARSGNVYRSLFPNASYLGTDVSEGPNVDVVGDAHVLSSFIDKSFDFVFSVSVFEHLLMPWVVAFEINKILKMGGLVYTQSHPAWPLHEEPWDFFRFSEHAYGGLFNTFTGFEIVRVGQSIEANVVPVCATGGALQSIDTRPTFMVSACIAKKVCEPSVDWSANPAIFSNMQYSH